LQTTPCKGKSVDFQAFASWTKLFLILAHFFPNQTELFVAQIKTNQVNSFPQKIRFQKIRFPKNWHTKLKSQCDLLKSQCDFIKSQCDLLKSQCDFSFVFRFGDVREQQSEGLFNVNSF